MMIFINDCYKERKIPASIWKDFDLVEPDMPAFDGGIERLS